MPETAVATGHHVVARSLRRKGDRAVALKPVMGRAADQAERDIRPTHHNRTGTLTRSLYGGDDQLRDIHDDGFNLGTQVSYGRFVFRGTKRMRARPPVINAAAIGNRTADLINQHLDRA